MFLRGDSVILVLRNPKWIIKYYFINYKNFKILNYLNLAKLFFKQFKKSSKIRKNLYFLKFNFKKKRLFKHRIIIKIKWFQAKVEKAEKVEKYMANQKKHLNQDH